MKRLFVLTVLTTMLIGMTGCQSRMFGRRGARCSDNPPSPAVPGCQTGPALNPMMQTAPMMTEPTVVIPNNGAIITEGVPMGTSGISTGPIPGSQVGVERQIVPGSVTIRDGSTVLTIPGPESAPIPRS